MQHSLLWVVPKYHRVSYNLIKHQIRRWLKILSHDLRTLLHNLPCHKYVFKNLTLILHKIANRSQMRITVECAGKRIVKIRRYFYQRVSIASYASAGIARAEMSFRLSVPLSVRLSVTLRYCIKTKKASVMISSPSESLNILVSRNI